MTYRPYLLAAALVACGAPPEPSRPVASPRTPPRVDAAQKFADLESCPTESGTAIAPCRLGYRTFGTLNAARSNAVLFPTWFTGNTSRLVDVVPDKLVDTTKFFLILVDALGDGVSTSPSNSATQPRTRFPTITIGDMVESQRRLLRQVFGIERLHAVMGISMGGMQALEWSVRFPADVERVVSIVGTPQLTSHDLLLWTAELHALTSDVAYRGGDYEGRPPLRAVLDMHQFALTTPEYRARETSRDDFAAWVAEQEKDDGFDWNDWRRQLEAMLTHDVGRRHGGLAKAASRVTARTLVVVAAQDHMVHPAPSLTFATMLGVTPLVLGGPCGHLAPGCEADKVAPAVSKFLAEPVR